MAFAPYVAHFIFKVEPFRTRPSMCVCPVLASLSSASSSSSSSSSWRWCWAAPRCWRWRVWMLPERLERRRGGKEERWRGEKKDGTEILLGIDVGWCACVRRSGGMRSCCNHDGRWNDVALTFMSFPAKKEEKTNQKTTKPHPHFTQALFISLSHLSPVLLHLFMRYFSNAHISTSSKGVWGSWWLGSGVLTQKTHGNVQERKHVGPECGNILINLVGLRRKMWSVSDVAFFSFPNGI